MLYNKNWRINGENIYGIGFDSKTKTYHIYEKKIEAMPRLNHLTGITQLQDAIAGNIKWLVNKKKEVYDFFTKISELSNDPNDIDLEVIDASWTCEYKYAFFNETLKLRRKQSHNLKKARARLCSYAMKLAKIYTDNAQDKTLEEIQKDFAINMSKYKITYNCNLIEKKS